MAAHPMPATAPRLPLASSDMATQLDRTSAPSEFTCLNCGGTDAFLFLSGCADYYMGKPGLFDYYRCGACALTQIHPIPADLSRFYESYQVHSEKSWLHEAMRKKLMGKGYYTPAEGGRKLLVLDYGCGDGWYLREMKLKGHDVAGFEANAEHAAELAKQLGAPVFADPHELQKTHAATFDVVTMHFVMEHLSDLAGTFAAANLLLKPGGKFYFMIPNIDSMEAKLFGRKWHGLDAPRHLQFLTSEHIKTLARRSSFDIEGMNYFSLPNGFAGSLSAVLAGRFVYPLFAALMLPSLVASAIFADGNLAVTLVKQEQPTS